MSAIVVPRVIPLFLHDVATSGPGLQVAHLEAFAANVPAVFRAKVEPSDVVDLIVGLLELVQPAAAAGGDASAAAGDVDDGAGAAAPAVSAEEERLRSHVLRVLWRLFDDGAPHAPAAYRALRTVVRRIQVAAEALAADEHASRASAAADGSAAGDETLADVSPVKRALSPGVDDVGVSQAQHRRVAGAARVLMDHLLTSDASRAAVIGLWRKWDTALIDVSPFTSSPPTLHAYLPQRLATKARVFRDFLTCTQRPKLERVWGSFCCVHVKTNIKARSDIMYRFLVEGYNYGVNAVIYSDVVGCTNRRWADIGKMTDYGWPEGWDADMCNDYAPGCVLSQYYSTDGWLTLRLKAKSFFSVGFSVSAWLVNHGYGEGFVVTGEIFHQDDDL